MKRITESKKKIVISSKSFDESTSKLKEAGYDVVQHLGSKKLTVVELIVYMDWDVVGIIAGTEPITSDVMECAPNLKVISRYGTGTDNIDLDYTKEHNIKVFITNAHIDAVAEHTITFMLYFLKNIIDHEKTKNYMLKDKVVGIIGYGNVGKRVHQLVKAFGGKVLSYDTGSAHYSHSVTLKDLLETSHIITIHCPLTKESTNLLDYEEFEMMNKDVILINTSRARIINESALLDFVKNPENKVGMDVCLHPELFIDKRNVIITHHEASYTHETRKQMAEDAINNILEGLK